MLYRIIAPGIKVKLCSKTWACVVVAETCNVDCVREKTKQKLQNTLRTLRKSIIKQQFYIQFSGSAYAVAQRAVRPPELDESCSTGQVLIKGKCGRHYFK